MTERPMKIVDGMPEPYSDDEMAQLRADRALLATPSPPDGPTLGDWCKGLFLWGRYDQVVAAIAALKADADPEKARLGALIELSIDKGNNAFRADLMMFKQQLGFTEAEVDESLWRADRVAKGDLSGIWPLPTT